MPKRTQNPIDAHVGARVRLRRMLVGMSQERLGELLGVTFQQIQKYEKGANRIGASRLFEVSGVLEVPVTFFFEGLQTGAPSSPGMAEASGEPFVLDFVSSSEGLALNRAFAKIQNPRMRRRVLELVRELAEGGADDA